MTSGAQALSSLTERLLDTAFQAHRYFDNPLRVVHIDVSVIRLNTHYKYCSTWVDVRDAMNYIRDPTCLVLSCEVGAIAYWFHFFSLRDLRSLCLAHGINPARVPKHELIKALKGHVCFSKCLGLVYIFRTLPVPRRSLEGLFAVLDAAVEQLPGVSVLRRQVVSGEQSTQGGCPESVSVPAVGIDDTLTASERNVDNSGNNLTEKKGDFDHLHPLDNSKKLSIIREWQTHINTDRLKMVVCAVCSKRVYQSECQWVDASDIDLTLLQNKYLPEETLPRTYNLLAYSMAILNPKGLESTENLGRLRLCDPCKKALAVGNMPRFALSNWLYYGFDSLPENVKDDFVKASLFDKMLIARARCNTVTCRFNSKEDKEGVSANSQLLGQARKGIRGNVMVAPLDVVRMNKVIPPPSESIRDTMCAVFVGDKLPSRSSIKKYTPVLVRKSRVKRMILFLFKYNPHYRFSDELRYSDENLNALFEGDEGIPSSVHVGFIPPNDAIDSAVADYTPRNVDSDCADVNEDYGELLMENVGYTDGDDSPLSYQAMKTRALERCLQGKPFIVSGKGSKHVPDFHNPAILAWLFPHLDPWGIGGFHHPGRAVKLTMEEQLSHLLLVDDSPFERDPQFAFVFYNICQKALIARSLRFTVAQRSYREVVDRILRVDPEILVKLSQSYSMNSHYKPVDEEEKGILKLLASLRMIAKHVPGSDGYKVMLRNEIRSLIVSKGTPTLFITLNPSDVDNPLVRLLAGHDIRLEDLGRGEDMSEWKRKLFAARNPSACARFFDVFISRFIKTVLRYGCVDGGLYGKCIAYYGTVEAQGKGTLHCHMLIWLDGHLTPQELKDEMSASDIYKKRVFTWMESVIKCEFPGTEGIDHQKQNHPRRISHKEKSDPHPGVVPMPTALGSADNIQGFWIEFDHILTKLLHCYSWHVHQATCWKYLEKGQDEVDENCRMGMTGEMRELTVLDDTSGGILLRRHHPKIAPYTDVVVFLLQCNMDIKFVGSGEAAKAFLYYVTDYITKASLPVHVGMVALSYAVKKVASKVPEGVANSSQNQVVGAVTSAVNSMMGRQEISHPQVMSYLVGGGDHYTSEKFSVLHWGTIRRFVQCYFDKQRQGLREGEFESTVSLSLGDRSISASNQQLDYIYRGSDSRVSALCLYDFVGRTSKARFAKGSDPHAVNAMAFVSDSHPQRTTHYLALRRQIHVPVLLGPSIPNPSRSEENKDEWAMDMLILFKPWRQVSELKTADESWTIAFENFQASLTEGHKRVIRNMTVLTECSEARDSHRKARSSGRDNDNSAVDEFCIALQDNDGETHLVDVSQVYQHDPFEYLEHSDQDLSAGLGDVLSSEASRLLDMCLVPTMEDLCDTTGGVSGPSRVSVDGDLQISDHQAVMNRKRKRLHQNEDFEANVGTAKKHRGDGDPLAVVTALRSGVDGSMARRQWRNVADIIITEMSLGDNAEQLRAFNVIANHVIDQSDEQLLMHVAGVGGTGKSHVIKSIVTLFEKLDKRHELLLGAPTGIAAVLIGGQTLHSLILATPTGKSRNMAPLTRIWKNVKYLIVDEVSMLGARFMSQLSSRMRQGKGDDISSYGKAFGGVNVIFMGDLGQLKPPKQHALYSNVLVKNLGYAEARNAQSVNSVNGAFLWRQVSTVVQLTKNQRHHDDPVYAAFLARLRLAECSLTGLHPLRVSDLDYLKSRLIENQALNPSVIAEFKDAPIIVGSKALRDLLNVKLVRYHSQRQGQDLFIYYSRDYIGKKLVGGQGQRRLWGVPSAVNREALGRLPLFIGMKVMVTENLAFDDGVVNGSEGVVKDIKYEEDDTGYRYITVVYVLVPGSGIHLQGLERDVVPIFPVATRIEHRLASSIHAKSKAFIRKQVPLVPAYAYTDFKSQGRTLQRAIVDLATARGQGVYVMLSRVKSLSGLLILRWFPPNKIYHRLPEELREELERLHLLAEEAL